MPAHGHSSGPSPKRRLKQTQTIYFLLMRASWGGGGWKKIFSLAPLTNVPPINIFVILTLNTGEW